MNALRLSARTPGKAALLLGKLAIYVSSSDTRRRILAPPRQVRRISRAAIDMGAKAERSSGMRGKRRGQSSPFRQNDVGSTRSRERLWTRAARPEGEGRDGTSQSRPLRQTRQRVRQVRTKVESQGLDRFPPSQCIEWR